MSPFECRVSYPSKLNLPKNGNGRSFHNAAKYNVKGREKKTIDKKNRQKREQY